MNVRELIETLSKLDPDADVVTISRDEFLPATTVRVLELQCQRAHSDHYYDIYEDPRTVSLFVRGKEDYEAPKACVLIDI